MFRIPRFVDACYDSVAVSSAENSSRVKAEALRIRLQAQKRQAEKERRMSMMAAAAARLMRPAVTAALNHWRDDWQEARKLLRYSKGRRKVPAGFDGAKEAVFDGAKQAKEAVFGDDEASCASPESSPDALMRRAGAAPRSGGEASHGAQGLRRSRNSWAPPHLEACAEAIEGEGEEAGATRRRRRPSRYNYDWSASAIAGNGGVAAAEAGAGGQTQGFMQVLEGLEMGPSGVSSVEVRRPGAPSGLRRGDHGNLTIDVRDSSPADGRGRARARLGSKTIEFAADVVDGPSPSSRCNPPTPLPLKTPSL